MPDWGYDGTRCHVNFKEVADAAEYEVWVGAYPDGSGAVSMARAKKSGVLVNGLRPSRDLYPLGDLFRQARAGQAPSQGKPSNVFKIRLVDAFGMK